MVIVCACEGPLGQPVEGTVHCMWCPRTYPAKEAVQVLKLLQMAAREFDNDGKPANEHVRRMALNKAAHKMAALKLKAFDEEDLKRRYAAAPPPPAPPAPPPGWDPGWVRAAAAAAAAGQTTNSTYTGGFVTFNFNGMLFTIRVS